MYPRSVTVHAFLSMQLLGKGKDHECHPGYLVKVYSDCIRVSYKYNPLLEWNKETLIVHNRKGRTKAAGDFMFYDKKGDVNFIVYGNSEGITTYSPRKDEYTEHFFNGQKKLTISL